MSTNKKITFAEHKEQTAKDCEEMAKIIQKVAISVREGNMSDFEKMWIEGGTEEGDAKINMMIELMVLRYAYRLDNLIS